MAAFLLLRQGRAGTLKTVLLEGQVFRGLAPTASLSAESGKSDKGLPPNSKKQSPPKNVVDPKERGKLLTTPTAAELSKNLTSPSSYSSVVNQGGTGASPNPDDNMLFTDEGVPKFLSRKTLVEFPQKVPSSFREQGSNSEALQESRRVTDSSSSSSSSSSDSESEEEEDGPEVPSQVMSKGKGRVFKPEASPSFENKAPQVSISAKEKTWSSQPHLDRTSPEKPHQAKKKETSVKPLKDRKDEPKPTVLKSQVDEEFMKQSVKEKKLQKSFSLNKIHKESQKPLEVKKISPDHTKSGLSIQPSGGPEPLEVKKISPDHTKLGLSIQPSGGPEPLEVKKISPDHTKSGLSIQPSGGPEPLEVKKISPDHTKSGLSIQPSGGPKPLEVKKISPDHTKSGLSIQPSGGPGPTRLTEETTTGRQLQATPPETRGRHLDKQVPEPDGEVAFFPFKKENVGRQVIEGISKANEEILEGQVPIKNLEPAPVHNKDVFDEKTAVLKLEAKAEITEDSATQVGDRDDTQGAEPVQAAPPPEPFDNTTYKNLQHHDYTPYTFLDVNLDLLKLRLPQPSSGRESPRH